MAKTSPPYWSGLLISLALSACSQQSNPTWHCTVMDIPELGGDVPTCDRTGAACRASDTACTDLDQVWCPTRRSEYAVSAGVCTHSEESCKKKTESDCISVK